MIPTIIAVLVALSPPLPEPDASMDIGALMSMERALNTALKTSPGNKPLLERRGRVHLLIAALGGPRANRVRCKNTIEVGSRVIAGPARARDTGNKADRRPTEVLMWGSFARSRLRAAAVSGFGHSSAVNERLAQTPRTREHHNVDCYAASR
ncbi:MAG: hypothetical protein ACI9OJ_000351 [Myxococcota bacterium]|jgi:hypothetical protein